MISRGVFHMLLATILFTTMNVFVKLLPDIPAVEIVFFRSLVSLVISFIILRTQRVSVWGRDRKWLLLRGTFGAIALVLYFFTIQLMPLATAVTIQFLTPIFTAILGIFMNRERIAPVQWLFFLIAFGGVVLVQGFDARVTPMLLLAGLVAAVFAALAYNVIRRLNTTEHPLVIIFYFPLVTLPVTGAWSAFEWIMPIGWQWALLLMVGLLTQFAQYFMTRSYQEEELSRVASLNYLGIIYALGYGWIIFDEHFNTMTYLGMTAVLIGVVLNIWFKHSQPAKK